MDTKTLLRWSGYAAIISAVLSIASGALITLGDDESFVFESVSMLQGTLMIFGLMGVYAFQHAESGTAGFLGFVLTLAGTVLFTGASGEIFGMPAYLFGGSITAVGMIFLTVGTLSAAKFSRWIPAVWILSIVAYLPTFAIPSLEAVGSFVAAVLFAAGFAGAGLRLREVQSPRQADQGALA